jgi:uncharacterized protein
MQKLQKIDARTNVITWFEIPVNNTKRAKEFYETILDIQMETRQIPETGEELTFFPSDPNVIQATSGRITGVLAKTPRSFPSDKGTIVYINAYPKIQEVLNKVEKAGGKILVPSTLINAGYIAVILDTEGNRVGLHAEE